MLVCWAHMYLVFVYRLVLMYLCKHIPMYVCISLACFAAACWWRSYHKKWSSA